MKPFGIDIGYGYTKAAADVGEVVFPSVIGRAENIRYQSDLSIGRRSTGRLERWTVALNGAEYFVGELALQQSRLQLTLLDRSRTTTEQFRVLFLAALAQLSDPEARTRRGLGLAVVTGLPVEYYSDRSALVEQLAGEHRLRVNGHLCPFVVHDLQVVPQPFGTLFDQILDDDGWIVNDQLARARVGIIDIGTYTTDYVLVDELTYVERGSGSLNVALSTAGDLLTREISDRFELELNLHQVDQSLRDRSVKVFGNLEDIGFLVDPILHNVAEELISKARTLWGEGQDLDAMIVTGGGGQILGHHFNIFPHARVIPEPAMSNVRGFLKYARRGLRSRRIEPSSKQVMPA